MAIVLDLETLAIDDAVAYVRPAAHLKDEAKIKASIEERAAKAALHPWLCRIIALGWCEEGEDVERVEVAPTESSERIMLREFWDVVTGPTFVSPSSGHGHVHPIVTFNGLTFDLPVLVARSILLGVKHPTLNLDRYRSPHIDLFQRLSFGDREKGLSLKLYAQRFGLDVSDAFGGKEIAQLYEDGNWDAIKSHCASDVRLTRQLAERLGVLKAPVRVSA